MPSFLKFSIVAGPNRSLPNSRHHEHIRAAKTSSDRLIRALTPESEIKFLAEDCFSRLRELIRESGEIDVGTSNHRNTRTLGHVFSKQPELPSLFGVPDCVNGDGSRIALTQSRSLVALALLHVLVV